VGTLKKSLKSLGEHRLMAAASRRSTPLDSTATAKASTNAHLKASAKMKKMSKRAVRKRKARKSPAGSTGALAEANEYGAMTLPARAIIAGCALISMVPLLVYWRQFSELFYYHDDFALLHELAGSTLLRWIFHPFAGESIVPLFKFLWIAAVWSFGGSYMALIVLQWLTHLAICLAFGWLLIRLRVPAVGAGFAVLTFGLASANIETLAWSMQWTGQLQILFFLLAWHALLTIMERQTGIGWYVWYVFCICASALSSSRGIVCGMILGLYIVLAGEGMRRIRLCAISLAPTALLILATWLVVPPFKETQLGHFTYSLNYFLMNPLYLLLPIRRLPANVSLIVFFGAIKLLVMAWAFYKSRRRLDPLLATLVAFDLATAAALGYARTYTGLSTATSSRYQYISLLVFAPMVGIVVAGWRRELQVIVFVLWIWLLAYRWDHSINYWAAWRGTGIRNALVRNAPAATFDPSKLSTAEARKLIEQFHLH